MKFFHYCSNEAFVSIVHWRSLWLSDLFLSNDYLEGQWLRKVFAEYCETRKLSSGDIDHLMRNVDAITTSVWAMGSCVSEEGDPLSQWRGYASSGAGVSVGLAGGRAVERAARQASRSR